MKRAALIAIIATLSACAPRFSRHPSAEDVLAALDRPWIGRADIEASLMENGDAEDEILAGICTASPQWLEVAHRLYDTSNAHWGEQLSSALSVAMTKEPKKVLERFAAGEICGAPEHLPKSCDLPDWRNTALRALHAVTEPGLAVARQHCEEAVTRAYLSDKDQEKH
jgi:hypothetical protein